MDCRIKHDNSPVAHIGNGLGLFAPCLVEGLIGVVIAGQTGLKDGAKVRLPGDPEPKEEEPGKEKAPTSREQQTAQR